MLLGDTAIQRIRERYPSPARKAPAGPRKTPAAPRKAGRHKTEASECWHWCPVGKHDWMHELHRSSSSVLDEWNLPCPDHPRLKPVATPKTEAA
jgi:hypothetical protein